MAELPQLGEGQRLAARRRHRLYNVLCPFLSLSQKKNVREGIQGLGLPIRTSKYSNIRVLTYFRFEFTSISPVQIDLVSCVVDF